MTTIFDDMLRNAHAEPDAPAFLYLGDGEEETGELSNAALATRALGIARMLARVVQPGDRVLLCFQPGLDFISALYGCFAARVGAVLSYPPRPRLSVLRQLLDLAADCDTRIVLTTSDMGDKLKAWIERFIGPNPLDIRSIDHLSPAPLTFTGTRPHPDEVAFLQYTSGSTGAPKGVVITHQQLTANMGMIAAVSGQTKNDRGVLWLPPYHDMGLVGGILLPVHLGCRVTLMPPAAFIQRPLRWLRALDKYKGTSTGGPNFGYRLCVDRISDEEAESLDLSALRAAFNGAEPIRESTVEAFARKFEKSKFQRKAFLPCYGMAESTLIISGGHGDLRYTHAVDQSGESSAQRFVSCGLPAPEVTVLSVDPQTSTRKPDGEVGELWVASPSIAQAYWGKPEQTEAQLRAHLPGDPNTFLRTGDLGFIVDGRVYVTGREKDLLIVRGRNLYPQDLERVAEDSHAALRSGRSAAFAVLRDDEEQIVLVLEVEREAHFGLDAGGVISCVRKAVSELFDVLVHSVVLLRPGSIPLTTSGKVRRSECRTRYLAGTLEVVAADTRSTPSPADAPEVPEALPLPAASTGSVDNADAQQFAARIERWFLNRLSAETGETLGEAHADRDFSEFGIDSLQQVTISGALSDLLNLQLAPTFMTEHPTPRRAARHLAAVHTLMSTLRDVDPDERVAILRSAQTERAQRFKTAIDVPAEHYEWSELAAYKALNARHQLLAQHEIPSPFFTCHDGIVGATTRIDGQEFLNFATNNYLALSNHPEAIAAAHAAVDGYGTSVSASRIVSGERSVHLELERELARFLGTQDALTLVSGNLTNTSLIGHLLGPKDLIVYDELSHDSLVQGAALSRADAVPFPHNDWQQVNRILTKKRCNYEKVLVFTEGTFSMDGDSPDLPRFVASAHAHRAWLMVDEALSLGTLGATGRGITEHLGVDPAEIDILMGVLSKSLASCGGYIAGNRDLIRYLRFTLPGHIYTTGMTGANAAAALAALRIIQREPERVATLRARAREFLELAQDAGLNTGRSQGTCVVPIIIDDPITCFSVYVGLRADRINVQPIVYPAVPKDASRLRFFFSCLHTTEQLRWTVERIVFHLNRSLKKPEPVLLEAARGVA
jgi:7-keto-8-aminopelargonate synthetase-like enzyme/acyl-CoA synthetase (AMP-forming)/AMP-acid ligase II